MSDIATGSSGLFLFFFFFFFNVPAPTDIYTLSLHDALPIYFDAVAHSGKSFASYVFPRPASASRSEEHTSELQSLAYIVCRLLLEKKKRRGTSASPPASTGTSGAAALQGPRPRSTRARGGRCAGDPRAALRAARLFFLMIRRPPRSTLFPYTTSSDLADDHTQPCRERHPAASRPPHRSGAADG